MDTIITPKISVIMPVYNSEKYISQAIESIIKQTLPDFELIIINDGSTDKSEEIVLSFTDPRIRFSRNKKNIGIVATRNIGLNMARGEFIAMMDADDFSFPDRLRKQFSYMLCNTSVGVCGAKMEYIGNKQGTFGTSGSYVSAFTNLISHPPFGQSSAFIRKTVLDNFFLRYNPDYPNAEDYKLWLDIAGHAKIYCLPETLVYYRWHTKNDSIIHSQPQKRSSKKVQKDWFEQVLNRKLTKRENGFFVKLNPSTTDYLFYNFLCFLILSCTSAELDYNVVMKHRMSVNRLALRGNPDNITEKISSIIVSKTDHFFSKMAVLFITK